VFFFFCGVTGKGLISPTESHQGCDSVFVCSGCPGSSPTNLNMDFISLRFVGLVTWVRKHNLNFHLNHDWNHHVISDALPKKQWHDNVSSHQISCPQNLNYFSNQLLGIPPYTSIFRHCFRFFPRFPQEIRRSWANTSGGPRPGERWTPAANTNSGPMQIWMNWPGANHPKLGEAKWP